MYVFGIYWHHTTMLCICFPCNMVVHTLSGLQTNHAIVIVSFDKGIIHSGCGGGTQKADEMNKIS